MKLIFKILLLVWVLLFLFFYWIEHLSTKGPFDTVHALALYENGEAAFMVSESRDGTRDGLLMLDLKSHLWTLFVLPGFKILSSIEAKGQGYLLVSVQGDDSRYHIFSVDPELAVASPVFANKDPVRPSAVLNHGRFIMYTKSIPCPKDKNPYCDPYQDLFLYDTSQQSHLQLTRMWTSGFTDIQLLNDHALLTSFFLSRRTSKTSSPGDPCPVIEKNAIVELDFEKSFEDVNSPLTTNCQLNFFEVNVQNSAVNPILDQTKTKLLYRALDNTSPKEFRTMIYLRDLLTKSEELVWDFRAGDVYDVSMSEDAKTLVAQMGLRYLMPKVRRKNLVTKEEEEFELSPKDMKRTELKLQGTP